MKLAMLHIVLTTCVILAVEVTSTAASRSVQHCNVSETSLSTENFTNCTARYNEDIELRCPKDGRSVIWKKVNSTRPLTDKRTLHLPQNQCEETEQFGCIYKRLHYGDAGMYYCQVMTEVETREYYVNLTVLAPPKILGYIDNCNNFPEYNECHQSRVDAFRIENTVNVTVEYFAVGDTSVEWSRNNVPLSSNSSNICNYTMTNTSNGMYHKSMITFNTSRMCPVSGKYRANVSNEYGWNSSSIQVNYSCNALYPRPPGKIKEVHSQHLQAGDHNVPISCNAMFAEQHTLSTHLLMCFAPHDRDFKSLNVTRDCITCNFFLSAECENKISERGTWKVSGRSKLASEYQPDLCGTRYTTTLTLPTVKNNDGGKIYCIYKAKDSTTLDESHVYEQYNVTVIPADYWHPRFTVPGIGALLLLLPTLVVIGAVYCHKKRMKNLKNQLKPTPNRRQRPSRPSLYGATNGPPNVPHTDIPSSDDDDLFQPASRSSVSVEHHSPSGVAIHPTMDITVTTPLLNAAPLSEPANGWITEGPLPYTTDVDWERNAPFDKV